MSQHTEDSKVEDLSADLADANLTSRSSLRKDIKSKWTTMTSMLAYAYHQFACDVHENCDGTCTGAFRQEASFVLPEATLLSLLLAAASPQKQSATREEGPHNTAWVKARDFSKHTYSNINSSAGEIRLLKLKKGIFRSDVVECEMITTSLDNPCEYNALSYYWGTGGATETILVDGRTHSVYASLNSALKAYREGILHDTPLWIDAVSINQEDGAEKSQQILLMRQIYSKSNTVFVHLGEAERSWFTGLDLAHLLYVLHEESKTAKDEVADIMYDVLPDLGHPSWSYFLDTFSSPWFRRTWILQEIALCKNARVCKGVGATSWEIIEAAYSFFSDSGLDKRVLSTPRGITVLKGMVNMRRMMQIKEVAHSPEKISLMTVLDMTHHFEASDPRDKIFGLLGLLGELPERLKDIVDYSLSVGQVYHKVAMYFVALGMPNRVLDQAGLQRQSPAFGMPSWVPDWNAFSQEYYRPLAQFRTVPFNATGVEGPYLALIETPEKLGGCGFYHHIITRLSDVKSPSGQLFLGWDRVRAAKRCYEESDHYAYENAEEAFARTLIVDDFYSDGNALTAVVPIRNLLPTFRAAMDLLENDGKTSRGDPMRMVLEDTTRDEVGTYRFQSFAAINSGRRFAVTDKGYMALVPECTEVGDAVAFLLGTRVPYTIRPDMSSKKVVLECGQIHARLIGDCYMHGMMDGEAMAEARLQDREASVIVLV